MLKKTQGDNEHQENNQQAKTSSSKEKNKDGRLVKVNAPSARQSSLPSNPKHQPVQSKNAPVIRGNPIATILQAISRFFNQEISSQSVSIHLDSFYDAFDLYMRNSKAMAGKQLALKSYLYNLEISIGKQGDDPRQNHELELLKDYLIQLAQKVPTIADKAHQLGVYINSYQNRFSDPKKELQLRGYRQVFIGKQSEKVVRVGYDPKATQHQMYLIDEGEDKVIDQHLYPEQNQEMIQGLFVGQKVYPHLLFNEIKDWTDKPYIKGVITPKEAHIKGYNDVPFAIELAVSVFTPVGVMNSAYKLGTGKDLMHPEKTKLSNWEVAFAVADLVLALPLGKIIKIPGKVSSKLGRGSDEAAELFKTGKKVGDDFVVEVAENSKYAKKLLKAEAKLAAKKAKKAKAVEQADKAYQKYKQLQKAKYARQVAKGMDGAIYIKFFPNIDGKLAYQGVKVLFTQLKSGWASFPKWLAHLQAEEALAAYLAKAPKGEMMGLYETAAQIRADKNLYQQMIQALKAGDEKTVEKLVSGNSSKASLASVALNYSKVTYGKANDLAARAMRFRIQKLGKRGSGQSHHAGSGSNVAVFEYIDASGKIAYKEAIATGRAENHAERLIIRELESMGIPKENVLRIYTELDACAKCTDLLDAFTNAKGFYSFELNDAGKALWKQSLDRLYQVFK